MLLWSIKNENSQFSAEKDTKVSILKFTLALMFYIVNSLLAACYSSIQSYFKIDLSLTMLFKFTFYIENHEPFGSLTKNFPKLDKNKSIVSRFSVFVVYKCRFVVRTVQKSNYVGLSQFSSVFFVFVHLFPDVSIKSTKLHFQSWKKIFSNDFALFP